MSGAKVEDLLVPFSRHQPHTGSCSAGFILLGLLQDWSYQVGRWGKESIHHLEGRDQQKHLLSILIPREEVSKPTPKGT